MDRADTADGESAGAFTDLVVNVASVHHRLGTAAQVGFVQTAADPTLAVGQFPAYALVHSKSLRALGSGENGYSIKPRKRRGISSFSQFSSVECLRLRLFKD